MDWRKVLAYITGTVDEELLLRNEYLAAENRILMEQLQGRLRLTDPQRKALAEIGYRLGRKVLADVANLVKPETILRWYRKLVAQKFDGSKARGSVGRPQIGPVVEELIVRMAREGIGIGVIPTEVVRQDLEAGSLRVIAPAPALPDIGFTATYASAPDSGLAATAARLAAEVAASPEWRQ